MIAVVFLIPFVLILVLMVLALCKAAARGDEPYDEDRPKLEVFNPPGPRYL
jgi:hypothetical protein